jgi:uncharacterized membrane protein
MARGDLVWRAHRHGSGRWQTVCGNDACTWVRALIAQNEEMRVTVVRLIRRQRIAFGVVSGISGRRQFARLKRQSV